jgi:hypothetical protein
MLKKLIITSALIGLSGMAMAVPFTINNDVQGAAVTLNGTVLPAGQSIQDLDIYTVYQLTYKVGNNYAQNLAGIQKASTDYVFQGMKRGVCAAGLANITIKVNSNKSFNTVTGGNCSLDGGSTCILSTTANTLDLTGGAC